MLLNLNHYFDIPVPETYLFEELCEFEYLLYAHGIVALFYIVLDEVAQSFRLFELSILI